MNITFPHRPGSGGPGSFQIRFENALKDKGFIVSYAKDSNIKPDLVFVVGGTRKIGWLRKMKMNNVPIVFRLDGIRWLHRKKKTSVKGFLLAEISNLIIKLIHGFFADFIVYQSEFVHNWWNKLGFTIPDNFTCINNGVDLNEFYPDKQLRKNYYRLVILEGTIDYTPYAVQLVNELAITLPKNVKIDMYGHFEDVSNILKLNKRIVYHGSLKREEVAMFLKNAIYLSLDINAACPNTVIEALACGSPVVGFDTGSLKELVPDGAGIIVPYGGDPWKLETPNYLGLADVIVKITENYEYYSINARKTAEEKYNINMIVDKYISVIEKAVSKRFSN